MKVNITSVHFKTDKKLEDFIERKVNKLSNTYDGVLGTEVTLKVENAETRENKIAEIKVSIRGQHLFAKKQSKTFEEATDTAVEALRRQLTKHKEMLKK
jgi:putative sigma-54 modulation protein